MTRLPALATLCLAAACATGGRPAPFRSPLLGAADVPPVYLAAPPPATLPLEHRAIAHVASASAATEVADRARDWSRLPATGRIDEAAPWPALHDAADLRAYVGRRDPRDATYVVLDWARALGATTLPQVATPADLVAWARDHGRLGDPHDAIDAGDVLVFDRTDSDRPADLVAVAIARDERGVIELVYLAGRTVRRGFADPARPSRRRDERGAILNTFMRAGRRWPPKGTHYLAGELLAHVVRAR